MAPGILDKAFGICGECAMLLRCPLMYSYYFIALPFPFTSPLFSCHGFGLSLSSPSTASIHSSPFTGLAVADASVAGAEEENEGHSTGAIMLAGIRAPTTASLPGEKARPAVSR